MMDRSEATCELTHIPWHEHRAPPDSTHYSLNRETGMLGLTNCMALVEL